MRPSAALVFAALLSLASAGRAQMPGKIDLEAAEAAGFQNGQEA